MTYNKRLAALTTATAILMVFTTACGASTHSGSHMSNSTDHMSDNNTMGASN